MDLKKCGGGQPKTSVFAEFDQLAVRCAVNLFLHCLNEGEANKDTIKTVASVRSHTFRRFPTRRTVNKTNLPSCTANSAFSSGSSAGG